MKQQKGFTIIELVVVILLLGILAATALPRFIDVTGEADTAVLTSTAGGLTTAAALYHAEWVAEGSQSGVAPASFSALTPTAGGYPTATDEATCNAVYDGLLQVGAPARTATTTVAGGVCTFTIDAGTIAYDTATGQAQ